ncbi:MAG: hypothetical protein HY766_06915 [candidate division NC10 bacterium]|nr:hypothetical protein [candidate division NC10 bacterium]
MKPKVLVTEPIHQVGWNLLAAETEAVAWAGPQAEPIRPGHPLAGLPNVLLTPHLGSVTEDGLMRMARAAAEEVLRVLQGEAPRYPVNPEALVKPNR